MIAGFFAFALTAAYWPGIAGVATTPRWIVGALLTIPFFFTPKTKLTEAHWAGLVLIAWLVLTIAWSESRLDSADAAIKLAIVATAFAFGSLLTNLRPVMIGAGLGLSLSSVITILQAFGWNGIESYGYPGGLFYNSDRLAGCAALVLVGCVSLRLWWTLPLILPSLALSESRASWIAAAVALALLRLPQVSRRWYRVAVWLAAGACLVTMLLRAFDASTNERLALWHDTVNALTLYGHGLGSFRESFPSHAQWFDIAASRPDHPHNEFLSVAYDGGFGAVVLLGLLGVLVWRASDHPSRAVLTCLGVLAMFAMPFHDPATVLLGSLCAGFLAGHGDRVRGLAFDCGSPLCADVAARRYSERHA